MGEDVNLGDLVSAFRLELRDGLAKMDVLGQNLAEFEQKAQGVFRRVGDEGEASTSRLGTSFDKIGSIVGSLLARFLGIAAIIELVRRLADSFISGNAAMDGYISRLAGMTGGLASARTEVERLEAFAAATGMKMGDLVDAYILLRQRGIAPTAEALTGLGNAAVATHMSMSQVAHLVANATMDAGRGLKEFGIQMSLQGQKVAFDWIDSSNRMRKVTVQNTDTIIQETLYAIFNDRYKGQLEQFANGWEGMWNRASTTLGNFLTEVGREGAWTELKAQLADVLGSVQSLSKEDLKVWAAALATTLEPLIQLVGTVAKGFLLLPVEIGWAKDRTLELLNELGEQIVGSILPKFTQWVLPLQKLWEKVTGSSSEASRAMQIALERMPGDAKAFATAAAAAGAAALQQEVLIDKMSAAGHRAAQAIRDAASAAGDAGGKFAGLSEEEKKAAIAFQAGTDAIKAMSGVYTSSKLTDLMQEHVEKIRMLHEHGVPMNEILKAMGPALDADAAALRDFEPGMVKVPAGFERIKEGAASGKLGLEDALRALDATLWKTKADAATDATVMSFRKAGGPITEALKASFGGAFDGAFADGERKFNALVDKIGTKRITVWLDFQANPTALADALHRLGVDTPNVPNTTGYNP